MSRWRGQSSDQSGSYTHRYAAALFSSLREAMDLWEVVYANELIGTTDRG
jgi:hypothetical protein